MAQDKDRLQEALAKKIERITLADHEYVLQKWTWRVALTRAATFAQIIGRVLKEIPNLGDVLKADFVSLISKHAADLDEITSILADTLYRGNETMFENREAARVFVEELDAEEMFALAGAVARMNLRPLLARLGSERAGPMDLLSLAIGLGKAATQNSGGRAAQSAAPTPTSSQP